MRILDLALKDLSQMLRDKRSLLFIVAMPIVFTLFMGFAYRGSSQSDEETDNRIPLALVDPQPESRLNKMLFTRLDSSDSIKVLPMNEDEAMDAFRKGEVAGVLVIPDGFSEQVEAGKARVEPSRNDAQLNLIAEAASSTAISRSRCWSIPRPHRRYPSCGTASTRWRRRAASATTCRSSMRRGHEHRTPCVRVLASGTRFLLCRRSVSVTTLSTDVTVIVTSVEVYGYRDPITYSFQYSSLSQTRT